MDSLWKLSDSARWHFVGRTEDGLAGVKRSVKQHSPIVEKPRSIAANYNGGYGAFSIPLTLDNLRGR
jgi:hypothetical protein